MIVKCKRPHLVPFCTVVKLSKLRLWNGMMYDEFLYLYEIKSVEARCFLAYDNDELLGWGLVSRSDNMKDYKFYVFVKPANRRKKVGLAIFKQARRYCSRKHKKCWVFAHDDKSARFYRRAKVPEDFIVKYPGIK